MSGDLSSGGDLTEPALAAFLRAFLGAWPDQSGLTIVGSEERIRPGWDGSIRRVVGVGAPGIDPVTFPDNEPTTERVNANTVSENNGEMAGPLNGVRPASGAGKSVISVPPDLADAVRASVRSWDDVSSQLPAAVGRPDARTFLGKFRWSMAPAELPDAGVWVPVSDNRVPAWLHPFGGEVLITFIDGVYAAGVGIKRHNDYGLELSVGTEEQHRGKGLARRLVAQAARWVIAQGAVPIYLHDPANTASDRTATAAGFPDLGWQILGVWGGE